MVANHQVRKHQSRGRPLARERAVEVIVHGQVGICATMSHMPRESANLALRTSTAAFCLGSADTVITAFGFRPAPLAGVPFEVWCAAKCARQAADTCPQTALVRAHPLVSIQR